MTPEWAFCESVCEGVKPLLPDYERPDGGLAALLSHDGEAHGYIRTSTGRVVRIDDPRWCMANEQVCIEDIAHALAYTSRFGGHAVGAYSVAQHCVRAAELADHGDRLWALMHDAPEAYMGDLVSPLKRVEAIRPAWTALEHEWDNVIRSLFCIRAPNYNVVAQEERVKAIDLQLLGREILDLLPYGEEDAATIVYRDNRTPDLIEAGVAIWSHKEAKDRFLEKFSSLTGIHTPIS